MTTSRYASAFGLQWNRFRRTQLDSYTGTTISRARLERCLGGSLGCVRDQAVLEVGCGAGRFTEVMLRAGARVFACDLSEAVVANFRNCGAHETYFVCQADALELPVTRGAFDYVVALGMLQHTPSPEATIAALATYTKPGGLLVLDHSHPPRLLARIVTPLTPRAVLRQLLLRIPANAGFLASQVIARTLLPVHRLLWRRGAFIARVRAVWRRLSPVYDYYDLHPELGEHLVEWALLDTHDGLTDCYKHLRTPDEISRVCIAAGLEVLSCERGGNGVEARARRPIAGGEAVATAIGNASG